MTKEFQCLKKQGGGGVGLPWCKNSQPKKIKSPISKAPPLIWKDFRKVKKKTQVLTLDTAQGGGIFVKFQGP